VKSAEIADTDDCRSDFLHESAIMPARIVGPRHIPRSAPEWP
jgi:hypothetical protein